MQHKLFTKLFDFSESKYFINILKNQIYRR